MKRFNGGKATEGRYQKKRKLGLVPLFVSEQTRQFITAAKENKPLDEYRRAHENYLYRMFG